MEGKICVRKGGFNDYQLTIGGSELMILDRAKVMALIPLTEDFYEKGKLGMEVLDNYWKCAEFVESDWDNVLMDIKCDELYCERTTLTKSLVDNFVKTIKAFFDVKITMEDLRIFENKKKDSPCILCFDKFGCVIAPRVQEDDKKVFHYEDYKDSKKEEK